MASYRTSRARRSLQTSYTDICIRLRAADGIGVDPGIRDYVVAAAIFLAHAEVENFISDILDAFANAAGANSVKGSKLAGELQSHLFLHKSNARAIFSNFVAGNSEKELLKSFTKSLRGGPGTIINDASKTMVPFKGSDIYARLKYPSADNLQKLFYRLGIDDIFGVLSGILKQDAEALIESIGSLRTQLAHTGTLPGISCKDVRDRLRNTERLVGALDRVMYKVTAANLGASAWASHIC